MERMLIATTPAAMEAAQGELLAWCDAKIASIEADLPELRRDYELALNARWKTPGIKRQLQLAGRRITFYRKVKAALEAGYYVVPNFPMDAFAIRTDRKAPSGGPLASTWARFQQLPRLLPQGEGKYVSPWPEVSQWREAEKNPKGELVNVTYREPESFDEVDFPVSLMRSDVMDATAKAMALELFDELGVARDEMRNGDPMILGHLRNPRARAPGMTFFIAWILPLDRI